MRAFCVRRFCASQQIGQGDILGLGGRTGYATGNHLHFEVRNKDGKAVDPIPLLPPQQ